MSGGTGEFKVVQAHYFNKPNDSELSTVLDKDSKPQTFAGAAISTKLHTSAKLQPLEQKNAPDEKSGELRNEAKQSGVNDLKSLNGDNETASKSVVDRLRNMFKF